MSIAVVTDSASDLELGEIEGITVVPLHLHFGDEVFEDGLTLSKSDFWQRMDRVLSDGGVLPTTSQPAPGVFRNTYQELVSGGAEGVISVHISGKLSGTLNSARQGGSLLDDPPPMEFVDTESASIPVGWASEAALSAVQAGAGLSDAADAARESASRTRVIMFVETLDYLLRGGRIGRARQLAGKLLRMRPLLELVEGEVEDIERPRTRKKAIDRLYAQIMSGGEPERVAIMHGNAETDATALAQRVSESCGGLDVPVILSSPVLGAHIGPGTVGAAVRRRA
ncbi:MAG: DegV family protein [Chloroflexi bacterium]|nr:DegV family protein [Chloroflexota bacterium]MCY3696221.1 DegV family protein [Chloroflexota bacterium]